MNSYDMSIGKTGSPRVRMDRQLERIKKAYDLTVEQYHRGISPLDSIPEEIEKSLFYKSLAEDKDVLNSGSLDVREYLHPESGMTLPQS